MVQARVEKGTFNTSKVRLEACPPGPSASAALPFNTSKVRLEAGLRVGYVIQ